MIIQEFLFAILIALIITLVLGLYRLGQLINAVEDRAKILQHRLLDMMKTPQQREYEEKVIDMFIDELNKKGKENNES
jgi:Sec-independent protein translocase protein TatA|tara:strand:+ start:66 stop:299 length:234 start_codon:yes stop_codon:yes gene_type:complete